MNFAELARELLVALRRHDIWNRIEQGSPWTSGMSTLITTISERELALILEECFYASLHTDEQRAVRFVLSVVPDPSERDDPSAGFMRFAERVPLSRRALRSLSPAADPLHSVLTLQRAADDTLRLTGLWSLGRHYGRPRALSFAVEGPGVMNVSFNGSRLLSMNRGELAIVQERNIDRERIAELLMQQQARVDARAEQRLVLADLLFHAARLIQDSKHGGSIWILNDADRFEGAMRRIDATGILFEVVDHIVDGTRKYAWPDRAPVDTRERVAEDLLRSAEKEIVARSLAQLSASDGAVVMTMEPRLIGFAAFIQSNPPAQLFDVVHGRAEPRAPHELGGGRHRSAAAFCAGGSPGERAALVVSQDGDVSLFMNVDKPLQFFSEIPVGIVRVRMERVGAGFAVDDVNT